MNKKGIIFAASAVALAGGATTALWLLGPDEGAAPASSVSTVAQTASAAQTTSSTGTQYYQCPNTSMYPIFSSAIPGNGSILNQDTADCFAWWEFITMNWPMDPNAGFGDPGDTGQVQWQTWIEDRELFPPNGEPPSKGSKSLKAEKGLTEEMIADIRSRKARLLRSVSKLNTGNIDIFGPDQFQEAAPGDGPNWLGSQNGHNVWYEVHVSPDEENFVVQKQFYNANAQWSWVTGDGGVTLNDAGLVEGDGGNAFNLPQGQTNGAVGSIETKAAWMEVDDPSNAKWNTYKLMNAIVLDPTTEKFRKAKLALVGFHILHKTASQQSWVWATFEHVMNVPGSTLPDGGVEPDAGFNFYNPSCTPQTVQVLPSCLPDGGTGTTPVDVTVGCTPNVSPPYFMGPGCAPVPIQVTRTNPIDSTASNQTRAAWTAIQGFYPNSVWLNYELVDVIWSSSSGQPSGPVPTPLNLNSMQPNSVVANTTLETYAQTVTCTGCHVYATIAPSSEDCNPQWNSDVSFLMSEASIPSGSPQCNPAAVRKRKLVTKKR